MGSLTVDITAVTQSWSKDMKWVHCDSSHASIPSILLTKMADSQSLKNRVLSTITYERNQSTSNMYSLALAGLYGWSSSYLLVICDEAIRSSTPKEKNIFQMKSASPLNSWTSCIIIIAVVDSWTWLSLQHWITTFILSPCICIYYSSLMMRIRVKPSARPVYI